MEKKLNEKQNRIIIVGVIVIVFVVLILFLFYYLHNKGILGNSGVDKNVQLKGLSKLDGVAERQTHIIGDRKCISNNSICLHDITIVYEKMGTDNGHDIYRGLITYTIENESDSSYNKPVRVYLGDYKLAFYYGPLAAHSHGIGTFGFENFTFDFDNLGDYSIAEGGVGDNQSMYDNIVADGAYDDLIVDYLPGE